MLFSVIVPVYNAEKYIKQCVNSILNQSYSDFEVVLVDDGSPDNCPAICDEYAKQDSRVKVIHKENGGHTSARLKGLEIATGEYVVFVDSDDYVAKNYLETFALGIKENAVDLVCVGNIETDGQTEKYIPFTSVKQGYYNRKDIENQIFPILFENYLGGKFTRTLWGKAIKKDLILPVLTKIDKRILIAEDSICIKSCVYKSKGISVFENCLYYYRQNPKSIIHIKKPRPWSDAELFIKEIKKNINLEEFDFREQFYRSVVHMLFNIVTSQFSQKQRHSVIVKEIKEKLKNPDFAIAINNCKTKNKKLRLARFTLKYKLFFIIKLYNRCK